MNSSLFTLLLVPILQAEPAHQPASLPEKACPEIDYVELSRPSTLSAREICISPGILTGIVFDLPVEVEFQEELRFMSVLQGRSEISFRAPVDLEPGERLRLTAKLRQGKMQQEVNFLLVSHPGHATHQVEVYHDSRPRESLLQDAAEEHAKNQRLQEENQQLLLENKRLQSTLQRFSGITGAYLSGALDSRGIRARTTPLGVQKDTVYVQDVIGYRSSKNVALAVKVHNFSQEDWMATGVSLWDARGNKLEGWALSRAEAIASNTDGMVFMEAAATQEQFQEAYTLNLLENGPRTVTVPQVLFPQ